MSISIHVMITRACRSIGSGHVNQHTCHDHACMPVIWQVFELRGVRDADLMLMSESDKEALLHQILSEQEAEHGHARQKLNKSHPHLHQYWIEIPLGSRETESTKALSNYYKASTVTVKDATAPASKKRKELPSSDLNVTAWGEVLGSKKVLFNAVARQRGSWGGARTWKCSWPPRSDTPPPMKICPSCSPSCRT